MFNAITLLSGLSLAILDTVSLPSLKMARITGNLWYIVLAGIVIILQTVIFYFSLGSAGLVVMNLLWDLCSDVTVTLFGFFYFKERLPWIKMVGVLLAFVSIALLSLSDASVNSINSLVF